MKGEYGFIDFFSRFFRFDDKRLVLGPGDDCAVYDCGGKEHLVLTVDEMVEGSHFLKSFSEPELIAAKLVRMNVSDVYSMGGAAPATCLVSSGIPPGTPGLWLERFSRALKKECALFGMTIAGGNMARSEKLHFAMTVIAFTRGRKTVKRVGARAGDSLYCLGVNGSSRAGLEILMSGKKRLSSLEKKLTGVFWKPRLYPSESAALSGFASCMLDNSDGLYKSFSIISSVNRLAVRARITEKAVSPELLKWCRDGNKDWRGYAVTGGEDYSLIFCVPPAREKAMIKAVPGAVKLGSLEKGVGVRIENYNGKITPFEHF